MLRNCPECQLQVSDKAIMCPHCGYPLQGLSAKKIYKQPSKRKRLPNGFGQISHIKNKNLRNPFRAMVNCGFDENGKPISKLLKPKAYFPTYNDAYAALVEYNRNPYDVDPGMTFEELYNLWYDKYSKKVSYKTMGSYEISYKYCTGIHKLKVSEMKIRHLKHCLEKGTINGDTKPSINRQENIVTLFRKMFDYAVEYEIVERNIYRDTNISLEGESKTYEHKSFTKEEMKVLWDNVWKVEDVDVILIQCYSGWRPSELVNMRIEDVDLENWTFTSGSKTEAGLNRTVPIHPKIRPLVERWYNHSVKRKSETLLTYKDWTYTYNHYAYVLSNLSKKIKINEGHKPHDPRKHFVTMAKKYKLDEYAIKYIVGHSIKDITENIYTERDVEWLRSEIEKIEK